MIHSEIKRIRTKLGLTQTDLAMMCGLSGKNTISNIETGFRNPSPMFIRFLNVLDAMPTQNARELMSEMFKQGQHKNPFCTKEIL